MGIPLHEATAMLLRLGRRADGTTINTVAPACREARLHHAILDHCRLQSPPWIALHGSMAHRTRRTEGEPDFVILCDGGRVLLVECKSKDGKVSQDQLCLHAHAKALGHMVHVVRSIDEFLKLL